MTIEFGKGGQSVPEVSVPALVMNVDAGSIRDYIPFSEKLPLVLLFIKPGDVASQNLLQKITSIVQKANGGLIALVIDAAASPELVQAFELNQIPSAYGLLKGQPAPLFVGDQSVEQIQAVLAKVLDVARENGLTGKATVQDKPQEPEISPTLQQAYEAIDSGAYETALAHCEKALLENPNDSLAEATLAQVKLLIRLQGKDLDDLIRSTPSDTESAISKADALIATGNAKEGFDLLLTVFEKTAKDQREPIRVRLVELFLVAGNENPDVIAARRSLSLLLF